jgi:hypothetical protein
MNSSQLSKENSNNELFEEVEEVEVVVHYRHSDEQTPHPDNGVDLGIVLAAYSCLHNEMPLKQHRAREVKCITISM